MQLLQFPFAGDRGQTFEEWERLVRQFEAQSSDTLQDTIKAAMLAHNPQDPEWHRHVGLDATRLQGYDALRFEWKAMHQTYRQWRMADGSEATPMEVDALTKSKEKGKGKEKGRAKSKDKPREGTPDKSSMKCFFCMEKGHARKDYSSSRLAEKKTVGHEPSANAIEEARWIFALEQGPNTIENHSSPAISEHEELCELIIIDSGVSVHVCPPEHGQENGLRQSKETRPLLPASGAEMTQHGMRQVSYDTEVGKVTADYRVLDVRRPIWSLGSMMDSSCDVHFTKERCWISKDDGKELDMIRSGGVFFVAARPAKPTSRVAITLELNPMTAAEVEQTALAREHAAFGVPGPAAGATFDGDGEPTVRIKVPTGPATPSAEE